MGFKMNSKSFSEVKKLNENSFQMVKYIMKMHFLFGFSGWNQPIPEKPGLLKISLCIPSLGFIPQSLYLKGKPEHRDG